MSFSKKFPKEVAGSNYTQWKEVTLSDEEEKRVEQDAKREQYHLFEICLREAKSLAITAQLNDDRNIVNIATALFEKRASHLIFWKERKAKEKFDQLFK